MDITLNYFELFGLPVSSDVNPRQLTLRYQALQKTLHPDRYTGNNDFQQRLSVQYTAYLNEAYKTLKTPLSRFLYLLHLAEKPVNMESNMVMDSDFLMKQMILREAIEELQGVEKKRIRLEALIEQVDNSLAALTDDFTQLWQSGRSEDLDKAGIVVQQMQFMIKVEAELNELDSERFD